MSVETLLNRLSGVRGTGQGKWISLCPAHDDRSPSLAVKEVDGRVLIHCFGGCDTQSVLEAAGLTFSALFPDRLPGEFAPLRRQFDPMQVLLAIAHEMFVVALLANDFKGRLALTDPDVDRLGLAVQRLQSALDMVGYAAINDGLRQLRRGAA